MNIMQFVYPDGALLREMKKARQRIDAVIRDLRAIEQRGGDPLNALVKAFPMPENEQPERK